MPQVFPLENIASSENPAKHSLFSQEGFHYFSLNASHLWVFHVVLMDSFHLKSAADGKELFTIVLYGNEMLEIQEILLPKMCLYN